MSYIKGIVSKFDMSLVIPQPHNHEVLGKIIMGYSRSTLSHAKGGAWPGRVAQMDALFEHNGYWNIFTHTFFTRLRYYSNWAAWCPDQLWKANPTRESAYKSDHSKPTKVAGIGALASKHEKNWEWDPSGLMTMNSWPLKPNADLI